MKILKAETKPFFVSNFHKLYLAQSIFWVLFCLGSEYFDGSQIFGELYWWQSALRERRYPVSLENSDILLESSEKPRKFIVFLIKVDCVKQIHHRHL